MIYLEKKEHSSLVISQDPPLAKRGVAKRSSNFAQTTEKGRRFVEIQKEYAYFKNEAKRILIDNQRQMGLNQSEVCILNTLIRFSSLKSWKDGKPICTATNARIADTSGYSTGTIPNVLKSLEDKGFIFRSYNKYNQRVGVEPISLAPFGSMLSEWEDEALIQWKLNKREQITGRKQTKQEIMITHDDKIEHSINTRHTYMSDEDKAELKELRKLKTIDGSSNHEPRVMNSSTKYIDKNTNNKKNIQKKSSTRFSKPVDNLCLFKEKSITHDTSWADGIWNYYLKAVSIYRIKDPSILQALKERSPQLMYESSLKLLTTELPNFNLKLLDKAIKGKLSTSLWRVGLMIFYSLYNEKIQSRPKYLCSLCRGKKIIHIEDNIKQFRIKKIDIHYDHNEIAKLLNDKFDLSGLNNKYYFFNYVVELHKTLGELSAMTWVNDMVEFKEDTIYFSKDMAIKYLTMKSSPSRFNLEFKHISEYKSSF